MTRGSATYTGAGRGANWPHPARASEGGNEMARLKHYCTCGAVLAINAPLREQQQRLAVWYATHDGPGHADTDAAGAEAARMGTNTGMGRETARVARKRGSA